MDYKKRGPLTPALSPSDGEREKARPRGVVVQAADLAVIFCVWSFVVVFANWPRPWLGSVHLGPLARFRST